MEADEFILHTAKQIFEHHPMILDAVEYAEEAWQEEYAAGHAPDNMSNATYYPGMWDFVGRVFVKVGELVKGDFANE
jgi:hypothetical protein